MASESKAKRFLWLGYILAFGVYFAIEELRHPDYPDRGSMFTVAALLIGLEAFAMKYYGSMLRARPFNILRWPADTILFLYLAGDKWGLPGGRNAAVWLIALVVGIVAWGYTMLFPNASSSDRHKGGSQSDNLEGKSE